MKLIVCLPFTPSTGRLIVPPDLISTLLSLSTAQLPLRTLTTSLNQVSIYLNKFRNRLSTEHSLHLKRLVGLLEGLLKYTEEWKTERINQSKLTKATRDAPEVITSGELMSRLGRKVEGVNLLEVENYLRSSKVCVSITFQYCILFIGVDSEEDIRLLCKRYGESGWTRYGRLCWWVLKCSGTQVEHI